MVTKSGISWITFQQFDFVSKRSKYSNRAVIVLYSNRAYSTDYNHCSHYTGWSKSFTFMLIVFKLLFKSSKSRLHVIALSY